MPSIHITGLLIDGWALRPILGYVSRPFLPKGCLFKLASYVFRQGGIALNYPVIIIQQKCYFVNSKKNFKKNENIFKKHLTNKYRYGIICLEVERDYNIYKKIYK